MHWCSPFLRLIKFSVIALVAFLPIVDATAQSTSEKRTHTDSQLWTETWINFPTYETNLVYGAINITRLGREMGTIVDKRFGGYVGYKFSPELAVTANYISITQSPRIDFTQDQERAFVEAYGKIQQNDWLKYTYRMRAERQFRVDQADRWNFRPRVGFDLPNVLPYESLTPFANFEGFYDSSSRDWYRLRTLAGINYKYSPEFNVDFYWGNQAHRFSDQADLSIMGFIFRFQIPDI